MRKLYMLWGLLLAAMTLSAYETTPWFSADIWFETPSQRVTLGFTSVVPVYYSPTGLVVPLGLTGSQRVEGYEDLYLSDWFGYYHIMWQESPNGATYVYGYDHGWQYVFGGQQSQYAFRTYDIANGYYFLFNATVYPWLVTYHPQHGWEWMYYVPAFTGNNIRWIWSSTRDQWLQFRVN